MGDLTRVFWVRAVTLLVLCLNIGWFLWFTDWQTFATISSIAALLASAYQAREQLLAPNEAASLHAWLQSAVLWFFSPWQLLSFTSIVLAGTLLTGVVVVKDTSASVNIDTSNRDAKTMGRFFVFAIPFKGTDHSIAVNSLSPSTIRTYPWTTTVITTDDFYPVYLIRPSVSTYELVANSPRRLTISVTRGGEDKLTFDKADWRGEALWLGADTGFPVPASISASWATTTPHAGQPWKSPLPVKPGSSAYPLRPMDQVDIQITNTGDGRTIGRKVFSVSPDKGVQEQTINEEP